MGDDQQDKDYFQEVATSCYGDMLADDERNKKYSAALKKAIDIFHSAGREAHVLDIGTGTGLLAMLAVKHGADSVVACEMFLPVARCASKIIEKNYFGNKIKVVPKYSIDLTVGIDMPQRANILVSEVFDTELIGEGAIKTFNHAHEFLLEEDCIVIPSVGNMYCQVVESEMLLKWNYLFPLEKNTPVVNVPDSVLKCPGAPALFDLQLSQVPLSDFTPLAKPELIFKFDFMRNKSIPKNELKAIKLKSISSGIAQVVLLWWDLIMDTEDEIRLSCAPVWCHPEGGNIRIEGNPAKHIPWRDHWIQAVYFLPKPISVEKDANFIVRAWHDEFSHWFAVCDCKLENCSCPNQEPPACVCGLHLLACRTRLAALNDSDRRSVHLSLVKSILKERSHIVVLGDFSLLGFMFSRLGAKKVYILPNDDSSLSLNVHSAFNQVNPGTATIFKDMETLASVLQRKIEHENLCQNDICIVGEPYYKHFLTPWENAYFYHQTNIFFERCSFLDKAKVKVYPEKMIIKACCVQFDDLYKINRPLNICEGFDISAFDKIVKLAKDEAQISPEPQPLWEYPCIAVGTPTTVLEVNFEEDLSFRKNCVLLPRNSNYRLDGIAVWCDIEYDSNHIIGTGPSSPVSVGQYISWHRSERQGVHIYYNPPDENFKPEYSILFDSIANFVSHFEKR